MQPKLPIKITQHRPPIVFVMVFCYFLVVSYAWGIFKASPTAGRVPFLIFFGLVTVVAAVLIYVKLFGKRLTLTAEGVTYQKPLARFSFAYADIEKVGYRSFWGRRGQGVGIVFVSRKIPIYLKGQSVPREIDISLFMQEDQLLFLRVLSLQARQALFGETIVRALSANDFPEKRNDAGVIGSRIEDQRFVRPS